LAIARQRIHLPPGAWTRALTGALSGTLWTGEAIDRFESAFAGFIGSPQAVAVPSGRAGLRFIFQAVGLEAGSEVICSAWGYPVVPHLVRSLGYKLKLADCETETLGMDPDALARTITKETRAVIATHLYGVPCRIPEIAKIAEEHGAVLIEDCAHCYGASVGERKAGAYGSFGYFSFETSKPINTLGGGMVTVRDAATAERLREVARSEPGKGIKWLANRLFKTSFEATVTHPLFFNLGVYPALRLVERREKGGDRFASGYHSDEVTMQGRMGRYTNYQAGLGLAQMDRVQRSLDRRVSHATRLMDRLRGKVKFQTNHRPDARSNYMLVTALFPRMEEVARELLRRGVDTKHRYMRDCSGLLEEKAEFPMAARAEREVLHLPAYPELGEAQIDRVADAVDEVVTSMGIEATADDPSRQSA
jgi:dTDP-4-amino-4,6-dideoxygalactose transaminase